MLGACTQLSDDEIEELQPEAPKSWWKRWRWHLLLITVSILVFSGGLVLRVLVPQQVRCRSSSVPIPTHRTLRPRKPCRLLMTRPTNPEFYQQPALACAHATADGCWITVRHLIAHVNAHELDFRCFPEWVSPCFQLC